MGLIWLFKSVILFILYHKISMFPNDATVDTSKEDGSLCKEGWMHHDKYCYKMEIEELNWGAADSKCRMMGGLLATVHSKEKNDFFEVLSNKTNVGYWWFGLHDQDSDGIYSWVDETDVDYTNWRSNEPYGDYDSGNCVAISFRHRLENHGKWFVLPCSDKIPYLCQMQTAAALSIGTEIDVYTHQFTDTTLDDVSINEEQSCEDGWIYKDENCYKMEKEELNWGAADSKCRMMGGFLATVHSKEENDFFEVLSIRTDVGYFWFGLHDQDLDGIFSWVDETDVDYTNWRSDEPYGDYDSGNCVAISYRHRLENQGKWFVLPCERKISYLCQKHTIEIVGTFTENDVSTTAAVSTVTENDVSTYLIQDTTVDVMSKKEGPSCEDGWIYKDQYCFKMEKIERNWVDASKECKKMNGNLVSIHSEKENDNVESIAKETGVEYWWIGLHEQDFDTTFSWDDNSDLNYTKWRPDEPDGNYIYGDCVAISFFVSGKNKGLWFVLPCRRSLPYLCQKQPVARIMTPEGETQTTVSTNTTTESEIETALSTIITTATETETTVATTITPEAETQMSASKSTTTESATETETETTVAAIITTETETQTTASKSTTTETETETTYLIQDTAVDEVPKKEGPSCEDGWIYKDHYCFKMGKSKRSWSYASNECKKMGGNLVSIHSEKQNDNLKNIARETGADYLWIGLHDLDLDNNFSWDDNSVLNYTKWGPGEPDGGSGSGDCVAISFLPIDIYHRMWFVFPCQETFLYLCQKQPISITENAELEQIAGIISVTTIIITIVVIIIFMALVGGILYYKRFYIQKQRPNEGKVFFRKNERVAKPSMEIIMERNKTR